jgi:hypothetical protein
MTYTPKAERIAKAFHETYERLAPAYDYRTRKASAVPWEEVPEQSRDLMVATVGALLADDLIREGEGRVPVF